MTLLTVNNLSVSFRSGAGEVAAVKGVSFALAEGQMLAIVGESGSGKSVTALSILQLLPYPAAYHPTGSITFNGQELVGAGESVLQTIRGDDIAMVFQEPMTALNPLHSIGKQIAEPLFLHRRLNKTQAEQRVKELLAEVGLSKLQNRLGAFPHELSGGERQRVMIAMALACDPKLLIADEPTTAIDATLQKQVLALLKKLQQERGMAILLITHDLPMVKRLADHVAVMKDGLIVEQGTTESVFNAPQHPYTQALLSAAPKGGPVAVSENAPLLLETNDLKVHFPIKRGVFARTVDHVKAVDGVSLSIREGETLGIVGESGSGKSTLAFALLRLTKSAGPIVYIHNGNKTELDALSGNDMRPLRKELQLVFQDPFASLNPRLTIGDIIGEGLNIHFPELPTDAKQARIEAILQEVGLSADMMPRFPHEFSGGQRQRISIARAMVLQPRLVVLDEPTSALDLTVQAQVVELLRGLQQKYQLSYIFISHDLRVVKAMSHRIAVMKNGRIVEEGPVYLLENPKEAYTRDLIDAAMLA